VKKKIIKISVLPAVAALVFLSFSNKEIEEPIPDEIPIENSSFSDYSKLDFTVDTTQLNTPLLKKDFFGFKEAIGYTESRGFYNLVNRFGYMGKYQFGNSALSTIGIYDSKDFVNNPKLQEEAFHAFTSRNKWLLKDLIAEYEGEIIDGVLITESGIIASAHLSGPTGVKRFLQSNGTRSFSDAFGTQVKHYMQEFGGYDLSAVKADKNAKVKIISAEKQEA